MISAYSNHANSLISLSLSLGELESFVLSLSRQAGEMGGCTTAGIISGQCMLDNLIRPKKQDSSQINKPCPLFKLELRGFAVPGITTHICSRTTISTQVLILLKFDRFNHFA